MKHVVIFTTPTCPHCRSAKDFLKSKSIPYTEKDITMDAEARTELFRLNIEGVPAFLIGGEVVIGFDRKRIEELLSHDQVKCRKCGAKLRLPSGKGTLKVTCPKCGDRFQTTT